MSQNSDIMQKPVFDPYNMVVVFKGILEDISNSLSREGYILTIDPNGRYDIVKDNK